MNFVQKLVIIYGVIFCSRLFSSCCNCEAPRELRYTDNAIIINNIDNSGREPILVRTEDLIKTAYGIQLQILSIEVARQNSWGFATANAYSCGCRPSIIYNPRDSITAINIISLMPFDALAAGSDVTNHFMANNYSGFNTVSNYVIGSTPEINYSLDHARTTNLMLMQPPVSSGAYQFEVRVYLSDGRVLSQRTNPINLI